MKSLFLLIGIILCFSSFTYSQGIVSLDHVDGIGGPDTLLTNTPIKFHIRFTNNTGTAIYGSTNGFVLSTPDGAAWTAPVATLTGAITGTMYDGGIYINYFSDDGLAADSIGLGGFRMLSTGLPVGFDEIVLVISTYFDDSQQGKTIILDSCWYPPIGYWEWGTDVSLIPSWSGPHTYSIAQYVPPTCQIEFTNCGSPFVSCNPSMSSVSYDHCVTAQYTFDAVDNGASPLPISYTLLSGPGAVDVNTGLWSYSPSIADVGIYSISIQACNSDDSCNTCTQEFAITNNAPIFQNVCNSTIAIASGTTGFLDFDAVDIDNCDELNFVILNVNPVPAGTYSINSANGYLSFTPHANDGNDAFAFTVTVSDYSHSDTCGVIFTASTECCLNRGDMNHSGGTNPVDISDITFFVDYLFGGGDFLPCMDEADANASGDIGISDLTFIVDYLFNGGSAPAPC